MSEVAVSKTVKLSKKCETLAKSLLLMGQDHIHLAAKVYERGLMLEKALPRQELAKRTYSWLIKRHVDENIAWTASGMEELFGTRGGTPAPTAA